MTSNGYKWKDGTGWILNAAGLILKWILDSKIRTCRDIQMILWLSWNPGQLWSASLTVPLSSAGRDVPSVLSSSVPLDIFGAPRSNRAMQTGIEIVG